MKRPVLILTSILIPLNILIAADSAVRLNSVGYLTNGFKGVTCAQSATAFDVRNSSTGYTAYTGTFGGVISATDSGTTTAGENLYKGDFTSFAVPGTYYVYVTGVGRSVDFIISDNAYNASYVTAMRAMYLWRCNTAVSGTYNGDTFSHAACHMTDADQYYVTGSHTIRDGKGGWHDAGDYNKYIVNAGITVGMMFMAWEHFGNVLNGIALNIPETAAGYPEYLKEMKYEIDWVRKMDYADGTGRVSGKLSATGFDAFEMPEEETAQRYFTSWGSAATADYVAMLAMAGRIFRPYDVTYADACVAEAWISYNYLLANTANVNPDYSDFSTGGYGTTDGDDRLWAAAEMWATTGSTTAHQDFTTRAGAYGDKIDADFDWSSIKNLGMYTYLMCTRTGKVAAIRDDIQDDLLADATTIAGYRTTHGYGRMLGTNGKNYYWGCNGAVARQSMLLQIANMVSPNTTYVYATQDILTYLFGRNMHRRSYVTGIGSNPPMNPHDRRSGGDNITNPWPGYLVGGSNGTNSGDTVLSALTGGLPAAYYWQDVQDSYASNEIAINWQGALIYALASQAKAAAPPTASPTASMTRTPTPYAGTPTFTTTATMTSTYTPIPTVGFVNADCVEGVSFILDGQLDDTVWQTGTWTSVTRVVEGTSPAPVSARYKVRWNSYGIYVAVDVTDPALYADSPNWYDDDSVEIYLDVNNNASTTYETDDFQYSVRYNEDLMREKNDNVVYSTAYTAAKTGGWTAELYIDWSDIGVASGSGKTVGFDTGVNYDQNAGTREGVLMWNGTGNNWQNTSAFGDAYMVPCGSTPTFTFTNMPTYTGTATASHTRTSTSTYTATPTSTSTHTPTYTGTATPTVSDTATQTSTFTSTDSTTPTYTYTVTSTATATKTITETATDVPAGSTFTFTPTVTRTVTDSPTATATASDTMTVTATATQTVTLTSTTMETGTYTPTILAAASPSFTPTRTFTATATGTSAVTATRTVTATHTMTRTATVEATSSGTPTFTVTLTQTIMETAAQTTVATVSPTPFEERLYPNPCNPLTHGIVINCYLPQDGEVTFRIYTGAYRLVSEINMGALQAGQRVLSIEKERLQQLSNGLYYGIISVKNSGGSYGSSKVKMFLIMR